MVEMIRNREVRNNIYDVNDPIFLPLHVVKENKFSTVFKLETRAWTTISIVLSSTLLKTKGFV